MAWQYSPYMLPFLIAGSLSASLALYAWLRRRTAGANAFAITALAAAEWCLCAALQHAGADLDSQLFWARLKYLGIVLTPVAWLCLALEYTGRAHWVTRRSVASLCVVPLATWALVWTNPFHGLFWRQMGLDTRTGFAVLAGKAGPFFWVHTAYVYVLLLASTVVLVQALARSPLVYRGQARSLLTAVIVTWLANAATLAGLQPLPHFDLTPFAIVVSAASLGWGLFRFGLLDLVPVAREAVIEGMRDAVIVVDARARLVDLNPAARRILGPRAEGAIGQPVASVLEGWPDLLTDAVGPQAEIRLGEGDAARSHEVLSSALHEGRGGPSGRLIVLRDVTERKRAEEALRRQNEYLAALLESSRAINSGLDLTAVLRNIALEGARLIGGEPGGIALVREGEVVFQHLWLEDRWEDAHLSFRLGEGVAGQVAEDGVTRIVNDAGADADVAARGALERFGVRGFIDVPIVDRAGRVVGVLDVRRRPGGPPFGELERQRLESLARQAAIAMENAALYAALEEKKARIAESLWAIEELYRNEQQVTRKLQELDLMKTNFMIVTSHEMRTPLTLLRGYIEALLDGYLGTVGGAQHEALDVCRRTVARMIASFNDILEMLQLDERRVALKASPTDLRAVAEEVLAELRPLFGRRQQRVSLDVPADLPPVLGDAEKLRLVLVNLVENAMKFTPDAGQVRIAIREEAGSLRLTVEDTGIGIEASELERIFEEFYTSPDPLHHRSGSHEFEARGAGLGLAIVRGHVEAHGGRVWAESPGRGLGSRFHVLLPGGSERPAPP